MYMMSIKMRLSQIVIVGTLVLFASPTWVDAAGVPNSDDILQSLGAGQTPSHQPAQGTESASKKGVMVFPSGSAPSSEDILQGLGVRSAPPKHRGIQMMGSKPPKIETPHKVYPGTEESSAQAKGTSAPAKSMSVAYIAVFPPNSDALTADLKKYADNVAEAMEKKKGLKLHISGHTDTSGGDGINVPLSLRRAIAFQKYLVEEHGISASRLSVSGEGADKLVNASNPYAPENRRVQIDKQ